MIVSVEYDTNNRPCRIIRTTREIPPLLDILATGHRLDESDVNWCKRDKTLYVHDVGCWTGRIYLAQLCHGLRHRLWVREGLTFCGTGKGLDMISTKEVTKLGYDLEQGPYDNSWRKNSVWGRCYYCERCDDMIPEKDHCECVYWCDDCCEFLDRNNNTCEHFCNACDAQGNEWCLEDHPSCCA